MKTDSRMLAPGAAGSAAAGGRLESSRPAKLDGRLWAEWRTMCVMVESYCRGRHRAGRGLCRQCRELLDYATLRLERCRFGADKPTCAKCPVHCYERQRREQMRAVMRYAGPRMIWQHPLLSLRHWLRAVRSQ